MLCRSFLWFDALQPTVMKRKMWAEIEGQRGRCREGRREGAGEREGTERREEKKGERGKGQRGGERDGEVGRDREGREREGHRWEKGKGGAEVVLLFFHKRSVW